MEKRDIFSSDGSKRGIGRQSLRGAAKTSASSQSVVRDPTKKWPTTVEEFDQMFDDGEDISHLIDWSSAERVNAPKRVNVDIPLWMVKRLDVHANRRGVTRQALIKMWLADRLEAAG